MTRKYTNLMKNVQFLNHGLYKCLRKQDLNQVVLYVLILLESLKYTADVMDLKGLSKKSIHSLKIKFKDWKY